MRSDGAFGVRVEREGLLKNGLRLLSGRDGYNGRVEGLFYILKSTVQFTSK
jgi:hypothetical protein